MKIGMSAGMAMVALVSMSVGAAGGAYSRDLLEWLEPKKPVAVPPPTIDAFDIDLKDPVFGDLIICSTLSLLERFPENSEQFLDAGVCRKGLLTADIRKVEDAGWIVRSGKTYRGWNLSVVNKDTLMYEYVLWLGPL